MLTMVLVGICAWAALSTIACVSVCMASARFDHEAKPMSVNEPYASVSSRTVKGREVTRAAAATEPTGW
jgi:hypothetical protein